MDEGHVLLVGIASSAIGTLKGYEDAARALGRADVADAIASRYNDLDGRLSRALESICDE